MKSSKDRIDKIKPILEKSLIERISWDDYAMAIANVASLRSEDPSRKVGAVALRHDKTIAAIGYNGAPSGISINWDDREQKIQRVIHAEVNCLRFVKPNEVECLYVTHSPCINCLSVIASYKIKNVVYGEDYPPSKEEVQKIAKEFNICLRLKD